MSWLYLAWSFKVMVTQQMISPVIWVTALSKWETNEQIEESIDTPSALATKLYINHYCRIFYFISFEIVKFDPDDDKCRNMGYNLGFNRLDQSITSGEAQLVSTENPTLRLISIGLHFQLDQYWLNFPNGV